MASSLINKQHLSGDVDSFRDAFKYYKRRKPPPDLDHVIDFTNVTSEKVTPVHLATPAMVPPVCMTDVTEWKAYGHVEFPGFVFIVNPFKSGFQRYWVKRCLMDYPDRPNRCNLDAHIQLGDGDNLWHLSQQLNSQKDKKEKTLIDKLRWVTLGYHHDWDTKQYSSAIHTDMPEDLTYLSKYVAGCLGSDDFSAEAAIVNYYHLDSTLSGHTDHSEFDLKAPLISFSLGQTAIFLLGGVTKATVPVAVYLRSGDITVLSGDCRVAYHAVPRILPQQGNTVFAGCVKPPDLVDFNQPTSKLTQASVATDSTQASDFAEVCEDFDKAEQEGVPRCYPVIFSSSSKDATVVRDVQGNCGNRGDAQSSSVCNSKCHATCDHALANRTNDDMMRTLQVLTWEPLAEYIAVNRINMNVRQVFRRGQTFPSAETDGPVDCSSTTS